MLTSGCSFCLVFCSNDSPKMHRFWARGIGQRGRWIDGQTVRSQNCLMLPLGSVGYSYCLRHELYLASCFCFLSSFSGRITCVTYIIYVTYCYRWSSMDCLCVYIKMQNMYLYVCDCEPCKYGWTDQNAR